MILIRMVVFVPIYANLYFECEMVYILRYPIKRDSSTVHLNCHVFVINHIANISSWISFILVCGFAGLSGYIASFIIIFNNHEKISYSYD